MSTNPVSDDVCRPTGWSGNGKSGSDRDFEEARWIRVGDPPIVRAKGEGEMENSSQVLVLDDK